MMNLTIQEKMERVMGDVLQIEESAYIIWKNRVISPKLQFLWGHVLQKENALRLFLSCFHNFFTLLWNLLEITVVKL